MYSTKWRSVVDRPIESYLPKDITEQLDAMDNEEPTAESRLFGTVNFTTTPIREAYTPDHQSAAFQELMLGAVQSEHLSRELNQDAFFPMNINSPVSDPIENSGFGGSSPVTPTTENASGVSPRMMKFVMPSGPRLDGEGIEEENQGILDAVIVNENALLVQMTLLVAGFIIGPSGESVRAIIAKSGATIYSYTEYVKGKRSRVFYVEGTSHQVLYAVEIMTIAVKRYKELAEGVYNGYQVDKKQHVEGVDFYYQPPPRSAVPYAASLRMHKSSKNKSHGHYKTNARGKKWNPSRMI